MTLSVRLVTTLVALVALGVLAACSSSGASDTVASPASAASDGARLLAMQHARNALRARGHHDARRPHHSNVW